MALLVLIAVVTTYITVALSPDFGRAPSPGIGIFLDLDPGKLAVLGMVFVQFPLTVIAVIVAALGVKVTRRRLPFLIAAGITCVATAINLALAALAVLRDL